MVRGIVSGTERPSAVRRVALGTGLALLSVVIALTALAYWVTRTALSERLNTQMARESAAFTTALARSEDESSVAQAAREYLRTRGTSAAGGEAVISLRLPSGRIISNSALELEQAPELTLPSAPPGTPAGLQEVALGGRDWWVATVGVGSGDGASLAYVALPIDEARTIAERTTLILALAGLLVALVGTLVSMRWARDIDVALERLEAAHDAQRRFVADASHELRTPIAVMRAGLDSVTNESLTRPEREDAARVVEAEIGRVTRMLDDLLSLARAESAPPRPRQPLHAPTLLAELAARARLLGDREIVTTCQDDAWTMGDPDLLEQALTNLARNAVDHTESGGRIELRCRADDRTVRFEVTDDGEGIPAVDLPRVFDRFYRSGSARAGGGSGAGLGLAITKAIVEAHDGEVEASSGPHGRGATLAIALPRVATPKDVHVDTVS